MKPLVIHPHLHPRRTGVTTHVETVVPALSEEFEVETVGRALKEDLPRLGWGGVWRRVRNQQAVWHAHRNNELLAGLVLRVFARDLKVVFTRHSTKPGWYTRFLAARADKQIGLTDEVARQLGHGARVVGHGIDLSRFAPPKDRAAAYRALGLPGERGIGVIGRVRPAKGQGDLAQALKPLLPANPDWHVAVIGRVAKGDEAFAEGLRQTLGNAATFVDEQPDIARWYQGLSIVVQPSHSEGFSLVLLEALASGCCVVAAEMPHYRAFIDHGRTGFLYPPGDVEALRALLKDLMEAPAKADAAGRAAAQEAQRRFGVDAEAGALSDIYRELLR